MFQRLKPLCTAFAVLGFALATVAQADAPAGDFLQPRLHVGEQLSHVFSRTISIEGAGFREIVQRVSGTGHGVVASTGSQGIAMRSEYRYDGTPSSTGIEKFAADGATVCWNGRCAIDRDTSGAVFNRTLWGNPPENLQVGSTWIAAIPQPWELGPAGTETVRVVQLDPASHTITLSREGHGSGLSLHDQHAGQIDITKGDGASLKATVVPGKTSWSGRTIVRDGVVVADTIMVERDVTLVTASGRKFRGKERAYTLENLLQDQT